MKRLLSIIFTLCVTSCYFFPFNLRVLPIVNTKMIIAGIGLIILMMRLAVGHNSMISKDFITLSISAAVVSLFGYISINYNCTPDYAYTTYIISMLVWLSSAYVVIQTMSLGHKRLTFNLLCNYLIGLCVAQCVLALSMEFIMPLKRIIYSMMDNDTVQFLEAKKRLSGLGAGLDVAGTRFSAVLILIIAVCFTRPKELIKKYYPMYIISYLIIAIIGNMIARTTIVGVILSLIYGCIMLIRHPHYIDKSFYKWAIGIIMIVLPATVIAYNTNSQIHNHIRFGFELFFNVIETGRWESNTTDILKSMVVYPETLKTWIIGDGFFGSTNIDPYYVGTTYNGFYMKTDIGYLRFIYYFGLLGLIAFSLFMIRSAKICISKFPKQSTCFLFLIILNFAIWFKVSTDIFLVFALFICMNAEVADETEQKLKIAVQHK